MRLATTKDINNTVRDDMMISDLSLATCQLIQDNIIDKGITIGTLLQSKGKQLYIVLGLQVSSTIKLVVNTVCNGDIKYLYLSALKEYEIMDRIPISEITLNSIESTYVTTYYNFVNLVKNQYNLFKKGNLLKVYDGLWYELVLSETTKKICKLYFEKGKIDIINIEEEIGKIGKEDNSIDKEKRIYSIERIPCHTIREKVNEYSPNLIDRINMKLKLIGIDVENEEEEDDWFL